MSLSKQPLDSHPTIVELLSRTAELETSGIGSVPDATPSVKGKALLDTAPITSSSPITVGGNSKLLGGLRVGAGAHPSIDAAITAAGGTPTRVIFNSDITIAGGMTIPPHIYLERDGKAKLVKGSGGAVTFQGRGTFDAMATDAMFSGFAAGDVQWTGAEYPKEISNELFDTGDNSLGKRINIINAAFSASNHVKIYLYPRLIEVPAQLAANRAIHFMSGTYPNNLDTYGSGTGLPAFQFRDNFSATAEKGAIINLSTVLRNNRLIAPYDYSAAIRNVFIEGLNIVGDPSAIDDGGSAVVFVGNAQTGHVKNCQFDNPAGYAVQVGGYGTSGDPNVSVSAEDFLVERVVIDKANSQVIAILNGRRIDIVNCTILTRNQPIVSAGSLIDCEPNSQYDNLWDININHCKIFVLGAPSGSTFSAIAVQGVNTNQLRRINASDNHIVGLEQVSTPSYATMSSGITIYGADEVTAKNNTITGGNLGLDIYHNRNQDLQGNTIRECTVPIRVRACADSKFRENTLQKGLWTGATENISETELEYGVASGSGKFNLIELNYRNEARVYKHFVGLTVTFNAIDYLIAAVDTVSEPATVTPSVAPPTIQQIFFPSSAVRINTSGTAPNTFTLTGHPFNTGAFVKYYGADPIGGLASIQNLYLIKIDANTLKFADTYADSIAGNAKILTSAGSGSHRITPIMKTKFSNNEYINNGETQIDLEPTGTSKVYDYRKTTLDYANFASLPAAGETGRLYVTLADSKLYRWNGAVYVQTGGGDSGGGSGGGTGSTVPTVIYGGTY